MSIVFIVLTIIIVGECCEPIREPLCQTGLSYNTTVFPNLSGHLFQGGASVALRRIKSLIERQCSPNIREFLCRVYMPECRQNKPVLPSWEMCQEAYEGCNSFMSSAGYSWAFSLNCSRFKGNTIKDIKKKAEDTSVFWFGNGVVSLCNTSHPTLACEKNGREGIVDSIVSRFAGKLDITGVDRLLQITYTYEAGNITSCNNEYALPGGSFQVDPLSEQVHHPWEVRHLPKITWSAGSSQYFTLIVYNMMTIQPNAIYINIPGGDMSRHESVMNYSTPMNPTEVENPYVFLLFEQNGQISGSQSLKNDPLSTIHSSSEFKGLKAMSWVKIQQDPYSINHHRLSGDLNNCPSLVSAALQHQNQPFLPSNVKLEMSIDVTYSSSSITFKSCCKTYIYDAHTFKLNPLGDGTVKTGHVRSSAIPSIALTRRDWAPNLTNFTGDDMYTLVMVDPYGTSSTRSHPYINWMVLDIPHGNVNDGLTVREYRGPQPSRSSGVHTYYVLLYKQTTNMNTSSVSSYTTCSRRGDAEFLFKLSNGKRKGGYIEGITNYVLTRYENIFKIIPATFPIRKWMLPCTFDINKFVTDNSLTLIGASWMRAENDEYIRHLNVDESITDMSNECSGQPDYPGLCSTSLGNPVHVFG